MTTQPVKRRLSADDATMVIVPVRMSVRQRDQLDDEHRYGIVHMDAWTVGSLDMQPDTGSLMIISWVHPSGWSVVRLNPRKWEIRRPDGSPCLTRTNAQTAETARSARLEAEHAMGAT